MFVIFVVPWFTEFSVRAIRSALELPGVRLALISQDPWDKLSDDLRRGTVAHWQVQNALDSGQLLDAAVNLTRHHGPPAGLFTGIEQLQVQLAEVRRALGVPGMSVAAASNFRDKARMKWVLQQAGLPVARFQGCSSEAEAYRFVEAIGLPVVLKPLAGAGSATTYRADTPGELDEALRELRPTAAEPLMIEELVVGDEHSFESFVLDGQPLWTSLTHYLPTPLEVIRNPWIQWVVLLPREVDAPQYDDIRRLNERTLQALGMETGMTHMEWFRRPDGRLAISEIAARPPGAQITTLISVANDFDCLGAWMRLMILGEFTSPERRYAAGAAYLRAQGRGGIVRAVHGLDEALSELGPLVVQVQAPEVGQAVSGRYEGDGFVIVRHPETDVVRRALERLVREVRVEAG